MPAYICKNKGLCDKADSGEKIELASYAETKCPECGLQLKAAGGDGVVDGDGPNWKLIIAAVIAISGAFGSAGYFMRCDIPFLKEAACHAPIAGQDDSGAAKQPGPIAKSEIAEPTVNEKASMSPAVLPSTDEGVAKANCQKAVEANQLDRVHICNRANAITLSNSGALSATMGKLADAEKDYRAAIDKDPDFYGAYLNYAALKVRQNQFTEAIEMIEKSIRHGFRAVEFIDRDPVYDKLRSDPVSGPKLKQKLDAVRAQSSDKPAAG